MGDRMSALANRGLLLVGRPLTLIEDAALYRNFGGWPTPPPRFPRRTSTKDLHSAVLKDRKG